MRPYKDTHQHTVSYTFLLKMSKSIALSLLAQGNNGSEILSILDSLASDQVSGFDYIESPVIEQVIGVPTLEEIAF